MCKKDQGRSTILVLDIANQIIKDLYYKTMEERIENELDKNKLIFVLVHILSKVD